VACTDPADQDTADVWRNNPGPNWGITWGPYPTDMRYAIMDGNGRFPSLHGNKFTATYESVQARENWDRIFQMYSGLRYQDNLVPLDTVVAPEIYFTSGTTTKAYLFCATPDAVIHYTLNGSTPTASSPVYTGTPLTITETTTVKAFARKTGMNSSAVRSKSVIILDNTSSGVTYTGQWVNSVSRSGYYGSNYRHDNNDGKGSKSANYQAAVPESGTYEVLAWWPAYENRAENVKIDITTPAGTETVEVDQRYDGGQWNTLGVYNVSAGANITVSIKNHGTSAFVIADAVKIMQVSGVSSVPRDIIMDNSDPVGVVISGDWTEGTNLSGYYGANYLRDGNAGKGTKSVRFIPTIEQAGNYEVLMRWVASNAAASNVPVEIVTGTGTAYTQIDQRYQGGQWNSLGVYPFTSGTAGSILIRNDNTNGHVFADAIKLIPVN